MAVEDETIVNKKTGEELLIEGQWIGTHTVKILRKLVPESERWFNLNVDIPSKEQNRRYCCVTEKNNFICCLIVPQSSFDPKIVSLIFSILALFMNEIKTNNKPIQISIIHIVWLFYSPLIKLFAFADIFIAVFVVCVGTMEEINRRVTPNDKSISNCTSSSLAFSGKWLS